MTSSGTSSHQKYIRMFMAGVPQMRLTRRQKIPPVAHRKPIRMVMYALQLR